MTCKDGQTQETSRRLNPSNISDQPKGLGGLQNSSSVNGIEQIRPDQVDCSKENKSRRTSKHGDATAGKILERLKLIEDKHLSHLKAHYHLLKSQLDQVKDQAESFRKEIQELEGEIYNLVSIEGESQSFRQENQE